MSLIVQKFGGTSVGDIDRILRAAQKTKAEIERGNQVAVVVSAMSGVTNQLVEYCDAITANHDSREYDSVVASGEQVTAGLFALALQAHGIKARSWLGWQVPILTDMQHGRARIVDIPTEELNVSIANGEVPIIAGFQGRTEDWRVTTLGRGGSDTSAVALAAALRAERCDIYTDVDGVYTTDPRVVSRARKIPRIAFEEMLEMASVGAKVLQVRSVTMAMRHRVHVQVLSTFADEIGSDLPGTLIVDEDEIMEKALVSGLAFSRDDAKVTLEGIHNAPGLAAAIFRPLSDAGIIVDMIVQDVATGNDAITNMTFTVGKRDLAQTIRIFEKAKSDKTVDYRAMYSENDIVKISAIGVGMKTHSGVALKMFEVLAEKGINIEVISTSEIKVSVLIKDEYTELALRALHTAYGLDAEEKIDAAQA
ncbi:MAG TPA: aspartate kinase [Rhodospirillaceae bacterium]|nr:aspartate kinase [Rhodospirillaceae bacterium]